jgi:hypothetical protein
LRPFEVLRFQRERRIAFESLGNRINTDADAFERGDTKQGLDLIRSEHYFRHGFWTHEREARETVIIFDGRPVRQLTSLPPFRIALIPAPQSSDPGAKQTIAPVSTRNEAVDGGEDFWKFETATVTGV